MTTSCVQPVFQKAEKSCVKVCLQSAAPFLNNKCQCHVQEKKVNIKPGGGGARL